jgi:hypothetical protein
VVLLLPEGLRSRIKITKMGLQKKRFCPSTLDLTCNPSYSTGRQWKAKGSIDPHLNQQKLGREAMREV